LSIVKSEENGTQMEELSDIKRDFNIGKMCRTCLMETEDEMHEIFGNSHLEADALALNQLLLQLSTNVQQVSSSSNTCELRDSSSVLGLPAPQLTL
jgi:hypothetical protein